MKVLGGDLKVGDIIKVWWSPNEDQISKLEPYTGSLAYLFPKGAQIATFTHIPTGCRRPLGMTIDNDHDFELVPAS